MNTKKITLFAYLLLLISLVSCDKWLYDDKLTLEKQPYNGDELRTDGYYYYTNQGEILDTYFFYRNGIIIHGVFSDSNSSDPIASMDSLFVSDDIASDLGKYNYGVFQIIGDDIMIEKWVYLSGRRRVLMLSGKIMNDTTFVLDKSENTNTGNVFQMDKLFHFHAMSHKPDSTNNFIP